MARDRLAPENLPACRFALLSVTPCISTRVRLTRLPPAFWASHFSWFARIVREVPAGHSPAIATRQRPLNRPCSCRTIRNPLNCGKPHPLTAGGRPRRPRPLPMALWPNRARTSSIARSTRSPRATSGAKRSGSSASEGVRSCKPTPIRRYRRRPSSGSSRATAARYRLSAYCVGCPRAWRRVRIRNSLVLSLRTAVRPEETGLFHPLGHPFAQAPELRLELGRGAQVPSNVVSAEIPLASRSGTTARPSIPSASSASRRPVDP